MKCNFVAGQKVVCVDTGLKGVIPLTPVVFPEKGKIYTIERIGAGELGVYLILQEIGEQHGAFEIDGSVWTCFVGFDPECFRPLETRKTDISVFTRMLNPSKEQVPA
jgi:hypothetical protein